jgi:hypothetical protein
MAMSKKRPVSKEDSLMKAKLMMKTIRATLLVSALLSGIAGLSTNAHGGTRHGVPHFVPNDQRFWDNSKNWTTDYGPAYRDTIETPEDMVPCNGPFALCFTSGPEPLPCVPTKDGRFANCTCTAHTGLNFVLISAILNYEVWLDTVAFCSTNDCTQEDAAPVCAAIKSGKLIPGADLISTFDPSYRQAVIDILQGQKPVVCPKAPYAACMTAACKQEKGEDPVCSCPVFNGVFQLPTPGAECDAGENLIPSSSFSPTSLNQ